MTALDVRDLLPRLLRAGVAIAATYSFLYYLLPATTGLDLVALLNLTLTSASAMLADDRSDARGKVVPIVVWCLLSRPYGFLERPRIRGLAPVAFSDVLIL